MALPEDLDTLERSIRQLQIDWDRFFSGLEKKPPNDLKVKVEAIVRRHANAEIRNNADRFRYQTLTARYSTFNELWSKKLRAREEGKAFGVHGLKAEMLPPPPPAPPPPPPRAAAARSNEFRVQNPERDAATVRSLNESFLEARTRNGESAPVKYESFQKLIGQQASRILTDKGGQAVEFRLETKDGKVSLKAKVVK
jgi:hypothetical protein